MPHKPKLLTSWCTVGSNSASIVWKYCKSDVVDKFVVEYHPADMSDSAALHNDCSSRVVINQFVSGRVQVTLLGLEPNTEYVFCISGVNRCGHSDSLDARLTTSPINEKIVRPVYFAPASTHNQTTRLISRISWLLVHLICAVSILFLYLVPWILSGADCERCRQASPPNEQPITYVKNARKHLFTVITSLIPGKLYRAIMPEEREQVVVKSEHSWFEWFDFEL